MRWQKLGKKKKKLGSDFLETIFQWPLDRIPAPLGAGFFFQSQQVGKK